MYNEFCLKDILPELPEINFDSNSKESFEEIRDLELRNWRNKEYAKRFGIGKVGANVWVLPLCNGEERLKNEKGKKLHSTQKPIELLKRVILTSTKEDDLILDPVAGTGTTGYVAQELKRNFVMVEINPKYVKGIEERFKQSLKITDYPSMSEKYINNYMNLVEVKP